MGNCIVLKKGTTVKPIVGENVPTSESKNLNETGDELRVPTGAAKDVIKSALEGHYLFACVNSAELDGIFQQINFWVVPPNAVIFEEGSSGKFFYILEKGVVEVVRKGIKKAVLTKGSTFGDHALLTDAPRSASVRALEECKLWGIERNAFMKMIKSINEKNIEYNKAIIASLPIFSDFDQEMQSRMAQHLVEHNYIPNFRVVNEGDKGSLVFIIIKGKAIAKLAGEEKIRLIEGEIFGEDILLGDNQVRSLSVYSDGNLKVLSISKENIISILGENFKSLIYRSQANLCLNSNIYTKMLSKSNHNELLDTIQWKNYRPEDVSIKPEHLRDSVFLLCFGNLHSKFKKFNKNDIIGLNDSEVIESDDLIAKSEVLLGELKKADIEKICKKPLSLIKFEIKNILFIRKIKMFSRMEISDLKYLVAELDVRNFEGGEVIYKYDDPALDIFIIKRGSVEVIDYATVNQLLCRGDVFGQECIKKPTRTNLARAISPTICICLPLTKLKSLTQSLQLSTEKQLSLYTDFSINQVSVLKPLSSEPSRMTYLSQIHPKQILTKVTVIKKFYFNSIEKINKLLQEKKILHKINSPFSPRMQKSFSDSKFVYFLHEYCDSVPLSSINRKDFSEGFIKQIAASLVIFLQEIHEENIFLRAITLDNVQVGSSGFMIFSEFRHAKISKSRTSSVVGDPFYMAPEMLKNQGYTKSIDLWALGILLHQLFYDCFPFGLTYTDEPMTVFEKINLGSVKIPESSQYIRGNEVLIGLLQKNPQARLSIRDLRYSKWLNSIDWESLSILSIQPVYKPNTLTSTEKQKPKKIFPLQQYLNDNIEYDESFLKQGVRFNWDKHF